MLTENLNQQHELAQNSAALPTATISVARPLTLEEVATYLATTTRTVRRWIANGELRAYRYGPRVLRVDPQDLEKFRIQVAAATYEHVSGGDAV